METRTIQEWADRDYLIVVDPDGFDRTDSEIMVRKWTKEEYDARIMLCSIISKPVDCKRAEKDITGLCLGYAPDGDDEPIETCKQCSLCSCYGLEEK